MKRFLMLLTVLLLVVALGGCCCLSKEEKAKVHENRVIMETFITQMADGQTTREHEQKMLAVNLKNWLALDYAVNDDEAAKNLLAAMIAKEKEGQ